MTIKELNAALNAGTTTSKALTQHYLDRIEKLNPKLNAYLTVFTKTALAAAVASDTRRSAGQSLGILDGIPLALKDNFSTKGQRTTAGSKLLQNHLALYDASVVRKLKEAGAVILGKTNLDEFAMGSSTENSAFGVTRNPWDTDRVPGGSSGGSAVAVAADLCAGAYGSDTGGSIRLPAGLCGVVGLKPTYGLVSRYGLLAMASSLDQIGPLAKTVEDAEILLQAVYGQDPYDSTTLPSVPLDFSTQKTDLAGLRIGVPQEYFGTGMDPEVEQTVKTAIDKLESLGAEIKPVSLPNSALALSVYYVVVPVEVASNMARYDGIRFGESIEREGGDHKLLDVYERTREGYLGAEVKRRIMLGTFTSSAGYYDAYYNQAMKVRTLIKQEFESVFETVDALASPVSPTTAWKLGEKVDDPLAMYLADINTVPVNLAGLPGISLPCGYVDKLPVGLQLIGKHLGEDTICTIAKIYEQSTPWHTHKPVIEV